MNEWISTRLFLPSEGSSVEVKYVSHRGLVNYRRGTVVKNKELYSSLKYDELLIKDSDDGHWLLIVRPWEIEWRLYE